MPRAAAGAQSLALGIGQTGPRLKKITALRRLPRLLEGQFCARALQNSDLYIARLI
jgi:hypothetical protein